ncbi:uricase [Russula ochroleuca]|uniref:factor independent urate hydroxylase n=1 Tax=Russula ochroleuca TaxID=152965 RepID=A0A9P5MLN8_9AGAM|nr:uricase [Russula ochroleuca]
MSLPEGRRGEAAVGVLASARYGKDKVRVFRVVRDPTSKVHDVVEYNVTVLVEGAIETSYTQADNIVVVATDSMKNIVNYLAKVSPHVLDPARFGLHLGVHLLSRYAHFTAAFVTVEQLRWARIGTGTGSDGGAGGIELSEHKHAFWRDGTEKRFVEVEVARKRDGDGAVARVAGGLRDLLVLKSTGSAFENFVRDEYTTLVEVDDRIFSTSVDLRYTYGEVGVKLGPRGDHEDSEGRKGLGVINFGEENFDKRGTGAVHPWEDAKVGARARETTLDVFAHDESASVQATLYKMGQRVLAENAGVESVGYVLPNKHYIPVDMKYIGVDNTTPLNAEVFTPVDAPSGLISATISRAMT